MEDIRIVQDVVDTSGNPMDENCAHCGEVIPASHVRKSYILQGDDGRLRATSLHMKCTDEVYQTYEPIDWDAIPDSDFDSMMDMIE